MAKNRGKANRTRPGEFWFGPLSPLIWIETIELQRDRILAHQQAIHGACSVPLQDDLDIQERWNYSDRVLLLIGIDTRFLVGALRRLRGLAGEIILLDPTNAELAEALAGFDETAGAVKDIRDGLEHFDEFPIGGTHPRYPDTNVWGEVTLVEDSLEGVLGELNFNFGGHILAIHASIESGLMLARAASRSVWNDSFGPNGNRC